MLRFARTSLFLLLNEFAELQKLRVRLHPQLVHYLALEQEVNTHKMFSATFTACYLVRLRFD